MADAKFLSQAAGPDPVLSGHYATKNYVDTAGRDWQVNGASVSFTLGLSDRGTVIQVNSSSGATVTVPTNATVAFPLGTVIRVRKIGTGNVTVAGASGVVINWVGGNFTISAQYGIAEIHKTGTDLWMGMLLP
jgi:hypothetical protein